MCAEPRGRYETGRNRKNYGTGKDEPTEPTDRVRRAQKMERYGTGQTDKCAHSPEIGRKVGYHKVLCVSALVNAISIVAIAKANHHQNRL